MLERAAAPLSLNDMLLPEGTAVELQGLETGAIHSFTLDEAYRVSSYDPAIKTPGVQKRYAPYTARRMAAVLLHGVMHPPALEAADGEIRTNVTVKRRIDKLCRKFCADNESVLIWTALFCGYLPDVAIDH